MISPTEYNKIVTKNSPKSKLFVNCIKAFLIGGAICTIGQGFTDLYAMLGAAENIVFRNTDIHRHFTDGNWRV